MSLFNAFAGEEFGKKRRLLCIKTQADIAPTVYPQIQHFSDLVDSGLYGAPPPAPGTSAAGGWDQLVLRLVKRLRSNAELLPLALVVMTDNEVNSLDWNKTDPGARLSATLATHATGLGIANLAALKGHYGARRSDWKPFGSTDTIEIILAKVLGDLNAKIHPQQLEWDLVDSLADSGFEKLSWSDLPGLL